MKYFLMMLLLFLGSSCVQLGSDPQPLRYYLLQPNAAAQQLSFQPAAGISLQPIRMPAYLDRPQLTTLNQKNQVIIAALDRWAEPLEDNFSRILKENLSRHLLTTGSAAQLWQTNSSDTLLVKLTINSFDGILGQHTAVDIRWTITKTNSPKQIHQGRFVDKTPIGGSYSELVQGLNRALDKFSYKLAQELSSQF